MIEENKTNISINKIDDGHIVVGYVAVLKVLDKNGEVYWATRSDDLNDMEAYGMMHNAVEMFREDLREGRIKQ